MTLTAQPSAGNSFLGWSGDLQMRSPSVSLVLTNHTAAVANFTGGEAIYLEGAPFFARINRTEGVVHLQIKSPPKARLQLQDSADLANWNLREVFTNESGQTELSIPASETARFFRILTADAE